MVVAAGGKLVLGLLLLATLLLRFADAVTLGEGSEGLQSVPLPVPIFLAGCGARCLLGDGLQLLSDRLVKTLQEILVVAPCRLRHPLLGSLPKTGRVFVPILQQHGQLLPAVTFGRKQTRQALRRLVVATAHQVENGLQRKGSGHD